MDLQKRVNAFIQLGAFLEHHLKKTPLPELEGFHKELDGIVERNFHYNGWFTKSNMVLALRGVQRMLGREALTEFSKGVESVNEKRVAVIMAGNIPAVGFHDFLCVLLSGHKLLVKTSSDDHLLIPFFARVLQHFEPGFGGKIEFAQGKLQHFDAVIATGNNNSSRYFDYYFGKYPHIIRKNRNSVAVLRGDENEEELRALGNDIFSFFGLGCRNVSKLYVPAGYGFKDFFEAMYAFKGLLENKKYANNYDYHRTLFLLEKINFLDNNFMILREEKKLGSQVSVLHYEFYESETRLVEEIHSLSENIQCLVGKSIPTLNPIAFGQAQSPQLSDFADKVNTLEFLRKIG
jgi:hypothetical protein